MTDKAISMFIDLRQWEEAKVFAASSGGAVDAKELTRRQAEWAEEVRGTPLTWSHKHNSRAPAHTYNCPIQVYLFSVPPRPPRHERKKSIAGELSDDKNNLCKIANIRRVDNVDIPYSMQRRPSPPPLDQRRNIATSY